MLMKIIFIGFTLLISNVHANSFTVKLKVQPHFYTYSGGGEMPTEALNPKVNMTVTYVKKRVFKGNKRLTQEFRLDIPKQEGETKVHKVIQKNVLRVEKLQVRFTYGQHQPDYIKCTPAVIQGPLKNVKIIFTSPPILGVSPPVITSGTPCRVEFEKA